MKTEQNFENRMKKEENLTHSYLLTGGGGGLKMPSCSFWIHCINILKSQNHMQDFLVFSCAFNAVLPYYHTFYHWDWFLIWLSIKYTQNTRTYMLRQGINLLSITGKYVKFFVFVYAIIIPSIGNNLQIFRKLNVNRSINICFFEMYLNFFSSDKIILYFL